MTTTSLNKEKNCYVRYDATANDRWKHAIWADGKDPKPCTEASIVYVATQPQNPVTAWAAGVGGGGGAGNFFFWYAGTESVVVTISPTGMTVKGTLTVDNLSVSTVVDPKNSNAPNPPNVANPQPGQIFWDESSIWIYTGQWEKTQLGPQT